MLITQKKRSKNQQMHMVEIHITQYHRYKYYYAKCRRSEYNKPSIRYTHTGEQN